MPARAEQFMLCVVVKIPHLLNYLFRKQLVEAFSVQKIPLPTYKLLSVKIPSAWHLSRIKKVC